MTDQKIVTCKIEEVETKLSLGLVVICHFGDWITYLCSLDSSLKGLDKSLSSAFLTCHIDRVVEDFRKWGKDVDVLEISETMLLLDYRQFDGKRAAILLEVATIQEWFSLDTASEDYYIFDDEDIIEIRHEI
jgi:hypothetical protein